LLDWGTLVERQVEQWTVEMNVSRVDESHAPPRRAPPRFASLHKAAGRAHPLAPVAL